MPHLIAAPADLADAVSTTDWELGDAETRLLSHGIHRYSGKFIPQIALQAIQLLTQPGELVVDIYSGSGTSLLEAAINGRRSIGFDLNPLAVLIARTKCTRLPDEDLSSFVQRLTERVEEVTTDGEPGLFNGGAALPTTDARCKDPWFEKWFQSHVLTQLCRIHHAVMSEKDQSLRNVGLVAFSDILRRVSNAKGGYPNVMFDRGAKQKAHPAPLFVGRLREVAAAIATLNGLAEFTEPDIRIGNATATRLKDASVDAVVTHPPYIGSIPYAEYGVLSLRWLGHDPRVLDKALTGGVRQSRDVVVRFRSGYGAALRECYRILRPGRHLFVMVGNPLVKGERIDLAEMTSSLAREAGFALVAEALRSGVNRRANKMGAEHLLFFQKPKAGRRGQ